MKGLLYAIGMCFLVGICQSVTTRKFINSNLVMNGSQLTLNTNDATVNFFALGDWGGAGVSTGSLAVAKATPSGCASAKIMGSMGPTYNTKFQLGLGDNFYWYGVQSSSDPIIKEVFEETYTASQLLNTPWFHTLGNHDHYGNAQGQVDYTAKSNRWILPSFNYTVDVMTSNAQKKLISIIMIDTIDLCGNTIYNGPLSTAPSNDTPIFANSTLQNLAAMYLVDFENKLKAASSSGVPYIIVGGHFPVYSVAEHGSTQCLVKNVMPLLHKYKVSAYLSGHDHNLQHISYTNLGSTVEYIVTGANALNLNSQANAGTVPTNSLKFRWPTSSSLVQSAVDKISGGFLMIQTSSTSMVVNFVVSAPKYFLGIPVPGTYTSTIMYTKTIMPRV